MRISGKEIVDVGYKSAENWCKNILLLLITKTATQLFNAMINQDSKAWFPSLKKNDL
jgi:hypothetical protein